MIRQKSRHFTLPNATKFTTAGPLVIDSLSITFYPLFQLYKVKPFVKNEGESFTLQNISISMSSKDSAMNILSGNANITSLAPGATKEASGVFNVSVDPNFTGIFNFDFEFSSDGWLYWRDSSEKVITGFEEEITLPISYNLYQNYPNPFNPSTTIKYSIPQLSFVTIKIYDVLGGEVATLVNENQIPGNYEVEFNSHSDEGQNLTSGVYFYKLMQALMLKRRR